MGKFVDLTGMKFGKLTVMHRTDSNHGNTMWKCKCDCGKETVVNGYFLKKGTVKSCGCAKKKDISGKRYGKLVAIKPVGYKNGYIWECCCDCGNKKNVSLANLSSGHVNSCGCLNKGIIRNFKHGNSRERIYKEYYAMLRRCEGKTEQYRKDYLERGITVCDEWRNNFQAFHDWAIKNGYDDSLTLDRIDNDGNYEPSNCRWVTKKQQANNRRTNVFIERDGKTKTLSEWSKELNIPTWKVRKFLLNEKQD